MNNGAIRARTCLEPKTFGTVDIRSNHCTNCTCTRRILLLKFLVLVSPFDFKKEVKMIDDIFSYDCVVVKHNAIVTFNRIGIYLHQI